MVWDIGVFGQGMKGLPCLHKRFTMQITLPGGEGIDSQVVHVVKKGLWFEISLL